MPPSARVPRWPANWRWCRNPARYALRGVFRNCPPVDMDALENVLLLSEMVCELPWLAELDINPLLVDEHGATLTGLPNRRLLLDRLDHELAISERTGRHGALLFIDLDNFKTINDTLGHAAGDQVLMEVARRLVASVRESDTVARLGGDEFVVILDNLSNTADEATTEAAELGSKILVVLPQPYRLGEALHNCTPSIGITTFCGHQASAGRLLRQADQAMYKAKSAGRYQLWFHTEDPTPAAPTG